MIIRDLTLASAKFICGLFFTILLASLCLKEERDPVAETKVLIEQLEKSNCLANGQLSFVLLDSQGKIMVGHNSDKLLTPASNLKIVTSAAALDILGPDFTFKTTLAYSGSITNDGVLEGDIRILGGGDPSLGSDRFRGGHDYQSLMKLWVAEIRKLGIVRIKGGIVADPGNFSVNSLPDGWIWTDIGNYYGAGSGGININENSYRLYFKPGKPGDPAIVVRVIPEIPDLTFVNKMKTGAIGSGDNGYIYGGPFSTVHYLQGTIPAGVNEFSIKGSIPDPAYFAAHSLRRMLLAENIYVTGAASNSGIAVDNRRIEPAFTPICKVLSPPLKALVKETNCQSINLYAEGILNAIGLNVKGYGSTEAGIEVLKEWLFSNGYVLPGGKCGIIDGSGLSPGNTISAMLLARLLHNSKSDPFFVNSLPVAGVSGTMKNFARNTNAQGRIIAKSGSFNNVIGYSGYLKTNAGELLPFSFLINNYECSYSEIRKEMEKVLLAALQL